MGNTPLNSLNFNASHGYLEGIVRGYRSGILTFTDYSNLTQCETIEDPYNIMAYGTTHVKHHLSSSDFGGVISGGEERITVEYFDVKMRTKLLAEFNYVRAHSVWPLSEFLDYLTYGYMIDNVILLITGSLNNMPINDLIPKCHPMGNFDGMAAVNIASNLDELYTAVIIDTPIAKYFLNCISEEDLTNVNIDIMRNMVQKAYLEDFYEFCQMLGNDTATTMAELLGCDVDRRAFMITINSLESNMSPALRSSLFPKFGKLYPEGLAMLSKCEDYDRVRHIGDNYLVFKPMFDEAGDNTGNKTIEDLFVAYEVNLLKLAFMNQFNFGVFYAYFKLREQEIRNVVWIAECIAQHAKNRIDNYIPIF